MNVEFLSVEGNYKRDSASLVAWLQKKFKVGQCFL